LRSLRSFSGVFSIAVMLSACADDAAGDELPDGAFTTGPGADEAEAEAGVPDLGSDETGPQEVSFAGELAPLIEATCFGAACHDQTPAAGTLNLSAANGDPYLDLTTRSHALSGMPYVTVGDPDQSYLYRKLVGTHAMGDLEGQGSGTQMPQGAPPLSPGQLDLFEDWILTGAMP
jgi:hypothetical protein